MDKDIIEQIFAHLNAKGFLNEDVASTEEEFAEKMFINCDERREIIKALILAFSDDYKTDLQKASVLDIVLARKIHELEFIEEENSLNFLLGKCRKEDQQKVYMKIFNALRLVAKGDFTDRFSSSLLTENLFKKGSNVTANKLKKQGRIKLSRKKFNVNQAMQNLELASKQLQDASQLLEQKFFTQPVSQQNGEVRQYKESKIGDLSSTDYFTLTMERHNSIPSICNKQTTNLAELGDLVGELHSGLQYVAKGTQFVSTETTGTRKGFNLDKMLEQSEDLGKTCNMIESFKKKCFWKEDLSQLPKL